VKNKFYLHCGGIMLSSHSDTLRSVASGCLSRSVN